MPIYLLRHQIVLAIKPNFDLLALLYQQILLGLAIFNKWYKMYYNKNKSRGEIMKKIMGIFSRALKRKYQGYFNIIFLTLLILLLILPCVYTLLSIIHIGFPKSNNFLELYLYTLGYGSDSIQKQMPQIFLYIFALTGVFIVSVLTAYITAISFKRTKNVIVSKDINIESNEDDGRKYIRLNVENIGSEIYELEISLLWHDKVPDGDVIKEAHRIDGSQEYAALPKKTKVNAIFQLDEKDSIWTKDVAGGEIVLVSYITYSDNFFGQRYTIKNEHKIAGNNVGRRRTDNKELINLFNAIPINAEAITLFKNKKDSFHADIHFDKNNKLPFTMALLLFDDPFLDLTTYTGIALKLSVKGLSYITLEIKDKKKRKLININIFAEPETQYINLFDFINPQNQRSFREINEICFTVFPNAFNNAKKLTGEFTIENFKLIQLTEEEQETLTLAAPAGENISDLNFDLSKAAPINAEGIDLHIRKNDALYASVNLNEKQSPPFVMALLKFEEPYLNWEDYYVLNFIFEFEIRGSGLSQIELEIKDKNKRNIIGQIISVTDIFELQEIKISNYLNKESFREINEICFTVSPNFFSETKNKTGNFEIQQCKLTLPKKQN